MTFAILGVLNVSSTDLTGARCGWTIFDDIDLSEVRGLGSVRHEGPSVISIGTLFLSKGHIPKTFLVGAGGCQRYSLIT